MADAAAERVIALLRARLGVAEDLSYEVPPYCGQDSWAKHYLPQLDCLKNNSIMHPGDDAEGGIVFESHRRVPVPPSTKSPPLRRRNAIVDRSVLESVSHSEWVSPLVDNRTSHPETVTRLLDQVENLKKVKSEKNKQEAEPVILSPRNSARQGSSTRTNRSAAPKREYSKKEKSSSFTMDSQGRIVYLAR